MRDNLANTIFQFRVLYRVFLLRVVDLELLSRDGDPTRLFAQFATLFTQHQLPAHNSRSVRTHKHTSTALANGVDIRAHVSRDHDDRGWTYPRAQLGLCLS